MNRFMMIIVICIAVLMTGATSKKMADDNETGEYIFSRNIGPNVIQVVFDTITVSKEKAIKMGWSEEYVESQQGDMITVDYPKIIEEQVDTTNYQDIRRFELLDENGAVLLEREYEHGNERWYTSENKEYIAFSMMPTEETVFQHTTFYNSEGEIVWEHKCNYITNVFNNGYCIGGWGIFYNKFGEEVGRVNSATKDILDVLFFDAFLSISILGDNSVYRIRREQWNQNRSYLMVTDSIGNEKLALHLPYSFARPDEYVLDRDIGIIGTYQKFIDYKTEYSETLKKEKNREIWEYGITNILPNGEIKWEQVLFEKGKFIVKMDKELEQVYLMSPFGIILCLDINTGETKWKMMTETAPTEFEYGVKQMPNRIKFRDIYLDSERIIVKSTVEKDNLEIIYLISRETGKVQLKHNHNIGDVLVLQTSKGMQLYEKSSKQLMMN